MVHKPQDPLHASRGLGLRARHPGDVWGGGPWQRYGMAVLAAWHSHHVRVWWELQVPEWCKWEYL